MTNKTAIMAAAIGALGFAAPASAATAYTTAPVERISYDDLDLATAHGQAELQHRVDRAAWQVCKFQQDGTIRNGPDHIQCYRAARQKVAVQVAQAIGGRTLLGG